MKSIYSLARVVRIRGKYEIKFAYDEQTRRSLHVSVYAQPFKPNVTLPSISSISEMFANVPPELSKLVEFTFHGQPKIDSTIRLPNGCTTFELSWTRR